MARDTSFKNFVEDQLDGLDGLVFRAMFGGHGIYRGAAFFGILCEDRLYFKTDETNRADYNARGMKCFQPSRKRKLKNYLEAPADVLEDREMPQAWARRACAS